jgi:REP element-mobilizing transposase RayT
MAQTLTRLLVHVIFSTKDRENLITPDLEPDLFSYMGGICRECESPLLAAGGMPDHVHLLVSLSKNWALSTLLQQVKKDSSKWIKRVAPQFSGFSWQDGYAGMSIGHSGLDACRTYIANQKQHHATKTFKEELIEFLEKYEIEFDEGFLWT